MKVAGIALKRGKLVLVTWIDSDTLSGHTWHDADEVRRYIADIPVHRSVAFVHSVTRKMLVLYASKSRYRRSLNQVGHVHRIPVVAIAKVRKLR